MKIIFWSNVRGQCGTTLHAACMAVVQATFSKQKVVMMENHDHLVNIETCFESDSRNMVRERGTYNSIGLENLMEMFDNIVPGTEENLIRRCAVNYAHDRLFYLPHGYIRNMDILDYRLAKNMNKLLDCLERYFDTVYVDAFSAENARMQTMLESADVIVVNLNQNSSVLRHFFRNFSTFKEKAVYLLGNYYNTSHNSIIEVRRKYQIPKERIYAMPYCREAAEAESQGKIADFISKNYLSPSISNREFINALHNAYNGIMYFYSSASGSSSIRGLSLI